MKRSLLVLFAILLSVMLFAVGAYATEPGEAPVTTPPATEPSQTLPAPGHTITFSYQSGHGTVFLNGAPVAAGETKSANPGETMVLTVTPNPGYRLLRWEVENTPSTEDTINVLMPEKDITVTVYFERLMTVTVDDVPVAYYRPGEEVELKAETKKGKLFVLWTILSGNLTMEEELLANETLSFIMPEGDVAFSTEYKDEIYRFRIEKTGKGTVVVEGKEPDADGMYECIYNELIVLTGTPDPGYFLILWSGSSSIRFSNYDRETTNFKAPASDFTVKVQFASSVQKLTLQSGDGGKITSHPEGQMDFGGDAVMELVATPDAGYVFDHWECSVPAGSFTDSRSAETSFTMPASDCTVTAVFRKAPKKLTVETSEGGMVEGVDPAGAYDASDTVSLKAIPEEGYRFSHWETSVPGVLSDENAVETVLTMPDRDCTVTAVFEKENSLFGADFPWIPTTVILSVTLIAIVLIFIREKFEISYVACLKKFFGR